MPRVVVPAWSIAGASGIERGTLVSFLSCHPIESPRTNFVRNAKTLHEKFKDQLPSDIETIQNTDHGINVT